MAKTGLASFERAPVPFGVVEAMDEPLAFPEIDHCLLIHDNRHEDEGASDVELVLFFWPSVVPLSKYDYPPFSPPLPSSECTDQILSMMQSNCSSRSVFMGKSLLAIFYRFACPCLRDEALQTGHAIHRKRQFCTFTATFPLHCQCYNRFEHPEVHYFSDFNSLPAAALLPQVLTAGLDYSRKSLEIQLDHVVQAFHFYHLSPENMEERARVRIGPDLAAEETERGVISPLRQAIINEYLDGGLVLTPMIQAFHNSLAKNFHPLQHSKHLGAYPDVGNIVRPSRIRLYFPVLHIIAQIH